MPDSHAKSTIGRLLGGIIPNWKLPREQLWREALTLSAIGLIIVLLEILGRMNDSEFFDAGSAGVLLLSVVMVASWHRRLRLHWTRRLLFAARRVVEAARRWRFEWGLDLRQEPPVARACPPLLKLMPISLSGMCAAVAIWSMTIGLPLRSGAVHVSYVVYATALLTLWSGMLITIIVAALLPTWTLMDMIKAHTRLPAHKAARAGMLGTLAYFVLVLVAAALLPVWVATIALGVIVLLAAALPWAPRTWYPDCLWRSRAGEGEVRSMSLGTLFSLNLVSLALIPLMLVLLALGPAALAGGEGYAEMPISGALGRITAWLATGGLLVFLGMLGGHLGVASWHDPSRHAATSVHISGVDDVDGRRRIRDTFARQRCVVRFAPLLPRREDVTVRVGDIPAAGTPRLADSQDESQSTALFVVSDEQLNDPQLRERIARRDVIQRRRQLTRGLESIFRRAASCKDRNGSGYWIAPHYWFVDGLTRDQVDDEDTNLLDVIPPLYYKAFPRSARRHFFEISRALKFDLIYVEDGVGYRNLRRVLRVLFERYDIDGGRQPLSDIHFAGLPKVRVMLHDYDFEEPPMKTKYPEPDYQHLGRVRILHVFRDRGEDEEQAITPEEPDWLFTPDDSPVLVG